MTSPDIYFLIGIVIIFVLFIILREFNCWYFKINDRINLQKEQNLILEKILTELNKDSILKQKLALPKEEVKNDLNKSSIDLEKQHFPTENRVFYDVNLTKDEKKQVNVFVEFGFKPGQRLAINKTNRKIYRFEDKEWNNINQSEWILLIEN